MLYEVLKIYKGQILNEKKARCFTDFPANH